MPCRQLLQDVALNYKKGSLEEWLSICVAVLVVDENNKMIDYIVLFVCVSLAPVCKFPWETGFLSCSLKSLELEGTPDRVCLLGSMLND